MPLSLGPPPNTGWSALVVGEAGYSAALNGPLHGVTAALHTGVGIGNRYGDEGPGAGGGLSARVRTYGTPYTAIEPGVHVYAMYETAPVTFYLRGTTFVGLALQPGDPLGRRGAPLVRAAAPLCLRWLGPAVPHEIHLGSERIAAWAEPTTAAAPSVAAPRGPMESEYVPASQTSSRRGGCTRTVAITCADAPPRGRARGALRARPRRSQSRSRRRRQRQTRPPRPPRSRCPPRRSR